MSDCYNPGQGKFGFYLIRATTQKVLHVTAANQAQVQWFIKSPNQLHIIEESTVKGYKTWTLYWNEGGFEICSLSLFIMKLTYICITPPIYLKNPLSGFRFLNTQDCNGLLENRSETDRKKGPTMEMSARNIHCTYIAFIKESLYIRATEWDWFPCSF